MLTTDNFTLALERTHAQTPQPSSPVSITTLLSKDDQDTYIIKAEAFFEYLNLVSLSDARRHAQRALIISLAVISISILLLLSRFLG